MSFPWSWNKRRLSFAIIDFFCYFGPDQLLSYNIIPATILWSLFTARLLDRSQYKLAIP